MTFERDRKNCRYKALHRYFEQKHGAQPPKTKYDKYILMCIIDLGEVYDENQDEIRAMFRGGHDKTHPKMQELFRREKELNAIGHHLRLAIGLAVHHSGTDVSSPRKKKLVPEGLDNDAAAIITDSPSYHRGLLKAMQRKEQ